MNSQPAQEPQGEPRLFKWGVDIHPDECNCYSYPPIFDNRFSHWLWKRLCCPRGWHLWDEVLSELGHCLYCDACEIEFVGRTP